MAHKTDLQAGPEAWITLLPTPAEPAVSGALVAVFLGHERVFSMLQQGKTTLLNRGELVLGSVSLGLGGYLSWQGITGLALR